MSSVSQVSHTHTGPVQRAIMRIGSQDGHVHVCNRQTELPAVDYNASVFQLRMAGCVVGSQDGRMHVWETDSASGCRLRSMERGSCIHAISWSSKHHLLATCSLSSGTPLQVKRRCPAV